MIEVNLYSCRYANTYYVVVAAVDLASAKAAFVGWLREQHGVDVDGARVSVRRKHVGVQAPIFVAA